MGQGRMEFGMSFGAAPQGGAARRNDESPFRVLVIADLGGDPSVPLAQRKPLKLDIDNFDQVLARVAPRRTLQLEGQAVTVSFREYDDFHPDALYRRIGAFATLQQLRDAAQDARHAHQVAVALGLSPADAAPAAPQAEPAAADTDDMMERLLGRKSAPGPTAAAPVAGFDMEAWIRAAVSPNIVPDPTHEQRVVAQALESALGELMRRVLHDPGLQALEANWRALDRLVREADWGETLQLLVLDASRAEIEADLTAAADDLGRSALYRVLCGPATLPPDGQPWSFIASDLMLGADEADVRLLAVLGAMAAKAGAPWVAGARPAAIGSTGGAQWGEPAAWAEASDPRLALWQALRRSAVAPWIGLAGPRILMRLPYGRQTDPVSAFAFEELPADRPHEAYLWGPSGLALALLAARAFQEDGWELRLESQLHLSDLPSHVVQVDGESQQKPGAEWLISEPAGEAVLERGVMPLMSYRNRDAVRLLRWQSIASPAQALQGAWT